MPLSDHLQKRDGRQNRPRDTSNTKVVFLVIVLCVSVFAAIALYLKGESVRVETEPSTLCAIDGPPTELLVVLLDLSDGYSEPQLIEIRNQLGRSIASVARLGLIEVYAVDQVGDRITTPIVHLCNPGSDKDVNQIYQNPRQARDKWNKFSERLDNELKRLMGKTKAPTSPIFEAVQSLALQTLNAPKFDGVPRRLIVVSDLLQNTPGRLSHYQESVPFEAFEKTAYFSDVRADLSDTEVKLLYLVRPGTAQSPAHLQFWEAYFQKQGGRVAEVIPVYGAH